MKRFDLQRLLPAHLAHPIALAVEATGPRATGACLLYAGHRLLRMLLAGRDGWTSRAAGFGRFRNLGAAILEPDEGAGRGPLEGMIADVLGEPAVRRGIQDLLAAADLFLQVATLRGTGVAGADLDAVTDEVEAAFARTADALGDFSTCTAGPMRPDLVYAWLGPRGFTASREAAGTDRPATLVRSLASLVEVGPADASFPPRPLLPFCGPEGTTWWEDPEGRVIDEAGAPAPLAPLSAGRALGRLLQWHLEPGQDGAALAGSLLAAGEAEAAGEVLSSAILWAAPAMSAAALDGARDFLTQHRLADQLGAADAFLLRRLSAAEAPLRDAADWAAVANVLLQKQMLQRGAEKVLTVQRLANVFRERLNDHEGAFYCLLSAIEQEPGDESLLHDLVEEAPHAGKQAEAATRLLDIARAGKGTVRATLAAAAGRFLATAGQNRKSFEAFLTALDGAPDDPGLLEEATTAAAAVGDNDALLALLGRRRDAAHDNQGRIEATLAAAKLLEDLGRTDEAAVEYRRALSVDPNRHEAFEALVALLSQAGSTGDARREYEAVLARTFDPGTRARVLRRYAALVSEAFRDDEAAANALQEALSLDPADDGLLDQLEPLYQRLGQWPRLMSLWRRRVERARNGAAVPVLLRMTEAAAGPMRDPESALAFATEAARRAPEDPEPRTRVRRLHETLGLWAEVCRDLERDVEAAPQQEKAALLARIGETYEARLSLADKAKAAFARALEFATGPEAVRVGKRLADLHRRDSERDRELQALEVAVKAMSDDTAADHLAQMGQRALEAPPDRDAAKGYLEAAVRLNPVHGAAVETLAGLLLTLNQPERVPALVEPLAAKAATSSDTAGERRLRLLAGGAAARVGDTEAALRQYARAAELDPTDTRTRVVLGRMYAQAGRDTEAARLLTAVLDSATDDLTPMDRIEVHVQTARCASRLGDHQRALSLLDAAFRLRGAADAETFRELVAAAEAAKDPERLAEYLDRWIAIETSGTQKFAFMLRLGDVLKDEMKAPERALRWYRAAQKENPSSKAALHKALDAAVAATDYREAKSLLVAIMELEQDGLKRAQYHYGAALIARDNLGDLDVTRQHLAAAIELNPDLEEAVAAQEDLLVQAGDHEGLAALYQLLARHYRLNGRDDRMVAMLRRLAACYEERLHNLPLAAETLRQIREAVPGDEEVADRLAAVLMRTPGREKDALDAHRTALAVDPTNAASYRAVRELCLVAGDADGAWCAAAALHALGAANEAEEAAFEAGRQAALKLKRDTLPPDAFRRLVVDEAADEGVGRVLHILYPPLRRLLPNMWKQPRDLGLTDADLVNPSERGLFQNMAAAASKVFGVPLPRVYRARGRAGIAKVPFDPPALAVGDDVLTAWRGKELRFSTARALVSFAPGFVLSGIADPGTLRVFFLAGLKIAFPDYPTPADAAGVDDLASELVGLLSPEARKELSDILTEFRRRKIAIDLHGFLAGADRTAARAGLFMANDLAVAKNQLADESLALSDLEFGDRLTDLCAYAVSARYAELRKLMLQV